MKKNDISKPNYEILATHAPAAPLDKREGIIYTYNNGITVLGQLYVGCMWFREPQQYVPSHPPFPKSGPSIHNANGASPTAQTPFCPNIPIISCLEAQASVVIGGDQEGGLWVHIGFGKK